MTTKITTKRIETFVNSCLWKILGIWWPEIISNERLWQRPCQMPVEQEFRPRCPRWIGHALRKPVDSIKRQALTWNPDGKRKRGRPRNTWHRDLEADVKETGYTWRQLEKLPEDRSAWRSHVGGLCLRRGDVGFDWLIVWGVWEDFSESRIRPFDHLPMVS